MMWFKWTLAIIVVIVVGGSGVASLGIALMGGIHRRQRDRAIIREADRQRRMDALVQERKHRLDGNTSEG
jgi:hypothetical protein